MCVTHSRMLLGVVCVCVCVCLIMRRERERDLLVVLIRLIRLLIHMLRDRSLQLRLTARAVSFSEYIVSDELILHNSDR